MSEGYWKHIFERGIYESEVPAVWSLFMNPNLQKGKVSYKQKTFGSFCCSNCRHKWNSANVIILFSMQLNKYMNQGTVAMRVFRQQCQKCSSPVMENPKINGENTARVICNVVSQIQKVFYNKKDPKADQRPVICGKLDGPHDAAHCEACRYNLCERQDKPEELPVGAIVASVALGIGTLVALLLSKQ